MYSQYSRPPYPSEPTGRLTATGDGSIAEGKSHHHEKNAEKALIPLPPTGLIPFFLCKSGCIENEHATHAGRRRSLEIGYFIL